MDARFIFEQVRKMRPSSFSEEEWHRYRAEKMMLRQFMLMKQQDQVPDHLSVRDMKTWLLTGRSFLEEFQEIIERTGINHLFMAELAWTTARHFCLSQMEEELLEELDKEKQLSQLFSRKVTLEGLQMFVSVVRPAAEEDVQTFLPSLHSKLLRIFGGIQITSRPLSAGDAKPAELLELEHSAARLVPEVVETALKFLLKEPERGNKIEAASAEIGKLLTNSAAPCLSQFGSVSKTLLLRVCTIAAQFMVKAIYKRFDARSKSFHQMYYDESFFSARDGVISAIQDMDHEVHLQLCTSEVLKDRPLEKGEASPRGSLDEDMATTPNDATEDTFLVTLDANVAVFVADELQREEVKESEKEETQVQDSAVRNMDHEVQTDASTQGHVGLSSSEGLEEQLQEKREASPGVSVDEEVATMQNDVTKDTSLVRLETSVVVHSVDIELEVLQQEEVEASETQESLVQGCAVKEKKGVRAIFRSFWERMTCCFCVSTED
ncbi:uncharacterized protein LOC122870377 [Siniperca chuatsi]|uniref:uncharacterized protein LOC122870377 n=1 Tax=Siniperca chuatsi TaxID=119488 RepID=UPI001CE05376|nr:uncharacterized protein LOC122870377 [Siniperca chuatsi]